MGLQLNDAQHEVVVAEDNIMCCACPGSGKTRVLIEKVKHVLRTRTDAHLILVTFSRDAAEEMADRLRDALGHKAMSAITVGTFHSLALKQLKAAGRAQRILGQIEINHLILRALAKTGLSLALEDAEAEIGLCKIDPEFAAANRDARQLTEAYQAELTRAAACDFTDIIISANHLMESGVIPPMKGTHLFIDEFQDIDRMQFAWMGHHLAAGMVACAVGDDDQSVYGFRKSMGYQGMMSFVEVTGARIITLDTNYRSTNRILQSASRLISNNLDRVKKKLKAQRGDGAEPALIEVSSPTEQAEDIADSIMEICASNPIPETLPEHDPHRVGIRKGQVAVLARTNRELEEVQRVFAKSRIPYLSAGKSIWDKEVLQVYLTLLTAIHDHESMGFEVALRWAGIGDGEIHRLSQLGGGGLWGLFQKSEPRLPSPNLAVQMLVRYGRAWERQITEDPQGIRVGPGIIHGVARWIEAVINDTYEDDDAQKIKGNNRARRDIRDLWLIPVAYESLKACRGSLRQRAHLVKAGDEMAIPRVILSTFHSSKGLEWEHVFLIGVQEGSVPKLKGMGEEREVEEERRIFYVAMTRARDSLTIYTGPAAQSEFLYEAGLHVPRPSRQSIKRAQAAAAAEFSGELVA